MSFNAHGKLEIMVIFPTSTQKHVSNHRYATGHYRHLPSNGGRLDHSNLKLLQSMGVGNELGAGFVSSPPRISQNANVTYNVRHYFDIHLYFLSFLMLWNQLSASIIRFLSFIPEKSRDEIMKHCNITHNHYSHTISPVVVCWWVKREAPRYP